MGIKYVLIFLLIIPVVSASSVRINEVMYNPYDSIQCPDANCEWIELYNNGTIPVELSGWTIDNNNFEDTTILPNEYIVIVRELVDLNGGNSFEAHWGNNDSIWDSNDGGYKAVDGYFSLKNSGGDTVILKDNNGEVIDSLTYSDNWGADGNGRTLEFYDEDWQESGNIGGTPGIENSYPNKTIENDCDWKIEILLDKYIFEGSENVNWTVKVSRNNREKTNVSVRGYVKNLLDDWQGNYKPWTNTSITNYRNQKYSPNLWENNFYSLFYNITELSCDDMNLNNNFDQKFIMILPAELNQDYTKIKINELFPNPVGYDNAAMPEGEFVELYNSGDSALDLENLSLKDNYGKGMDIFISNSNTFSTIINPNNYLVVYMNGLSGFLNNDGFEKISLYKDDYLLDEVSYSGSTEDLTLSKINDKWVLSLPTPNSENYNNESDITSSKIKIDKIHGLGSDNIAKFGQMIKIRLEIYKGDTNKESIKLYVEDKNGDRISKESRVNVEDKFTDYTFSVPIQLVPNCKEKFSGGIYYIIVSGLEDTDKEEIKVEGITSSLCEVIREYKETVKGSVGDSESVLNEEFITGNVIYEGKSEKEGRYAIYFFCFSLIMLIMYLILRKNEENNL